MLYFRSQITSSFHAAFYCKGLRVHFKYTLREVFLLPISTPSFFNLELLLPHLFTNLTIINLSTSSFFFMEVGEQCLYPAFQVAHHTKATDIPDLIIVQSLSIPCITRLFLLWCLCICSISFLYAFLLDTIHPWIRIYSLSTSEAQARIGWGKCNCLVWLRKHPGKNFSHYRQPLWSFPELSDC